MTITATTPSQDTSTQQTVFGWFENDVYVGLLTVALYLGTLRLHGNTLVPRS